MPKFGDQWVIDRTFFEYVNGGECACCGFPHMFPGGIEGAINAISDLETDAAQAEIKANEKSPWPPEMREEVWADRLRLRYKMKKEMNTYKTFWTKHSEPFEAWCRSLPPKKLRRNLQMARTEVTERLHSKYGIHSAFGIVLCNVVEQVAHFKDTKYPVDARGASEVAFEGKLIFDRRGGFTMRLADKKGVLQEDIFQVWLGRMKSLGGPKLLERAPKKRPVVVEGDGNDEDEENEEGGADDAVTPEDAGGEDKSEQGPSFRSDRRIIRLLIARYFADNLIEKYTKAMEEEAEAEKSERAEEGTDKENDKEVGKEKKKKTNKDDGDKQQDDAGEVEKELEHEHEHTHKAAAE